MDITGNIIAVMPAQSGVSARTGNPWMTQEYVLEIPGSFTRHMCFRIFGEDRIKQFALSQGDTNVTIQFDIDAREYNGRWFNDIRCYNVIKLSSQQAPQPAGQQATAPAAAPFPPPQPSQGNDDLPF